MSRNDTRDERDQHTEQEQLGRMVLSQGRSGGGGSDLSSGGHQGRKGESGGAEGSARKAVPSQSKGRDQSHSRSRETVRQPDRAYHLSAAERSLMAEVGKFRIIAVADVAEFRYGNDRPKLRQDLANLKAQGLVQQRRVKPSDGRSKFSVLTLTEEGQRFVRGDNSAESGQSYYAGFVKPQEVEHDAAIYRMYQTEGTKIEERGGSIRRVVLDYELKKNTYSPLAKARELPPLEFAARQAEVAAANDLKVVEGKIPLPDLRIEYETQEGDLSKVDLELATEHYHGSHAAGKVKAGFTVYADSASAARLNAALTYGGSSPQNGPELTAAILSL